MQKISEVMSTDVHVISPDATIEEAAQEMRDGDFGLLPVAEDEDEQLLGVKPTAILRSGQLPGERVPIRKWRKSCPKG